MTVIHLGSESAKSKSWWSNLKQKWKGRKQKKYDLELATAIIKVIGLKPTAITYNYDNQYADILWRRSHNPEEYFQLRVGESLFVEIEERPDAKFLCVWARFSHPESANKGAIPFVIHSTSDMSELIMECRQAILLLRSEMLK